MPHRTSESLQGDIRRLPGLPGLRSRTVSLRNGASRTHGYGFRVGQRGRGGTFQTGTSCVLRRVGIGPNRLTSVVGRDVAVDRLLALVSNRLDGLPVPQALVRHRVSSCRAEGLEPRYRTEASRLGLWPAASVCPESLTELLSPFAPSSSSTLRRSLLTTFLCGIYTPMIWDVEYTDEHLDELREEGLIA